MSREIHLTSNDLAEVDEEKKLVRKARETLREVVNSKLLLPPEESPEEDEAYSSVQTRGFEVRQEPVQKESPE